jgi:hypothetical protein
MLHEVQRENPDVCLALTKEYYKDANYSFVSYAALPQKVVDHFEEWSMGTKCDDYKPKDFINIIKIDHGRDDITYAAYQDISGLKTFYLCDYLEGEIAGYSRVAQDPPSRPWKKANSLISYTFTKDKYKRMGFGTRRVQIMNALSRSFLGTSLLSDTTISPSATSLWEKLELKGKARKFTQRGCKRFVLLDN